MSIHRIDYIYIYVYNVNWCLDCCGFAWRMWWGTNICSKQWLGMQRLVESDGMPWLPKLCSKSGLKANKDESTIHCSFWEPRKHPKCNFDWNFVKSGTCSAEVYLRIEMPTHGYTMWEHFKPTAPGWKHQHFYRNTDTFDNFWYGWYRDTSGCFFVFSLSLSLPL